MKCCLSAVFLILLWLLKSTDGFCQPTTTVTTVTTTAPPGANIKDQTYGDYKEHIGYEYYSHVRVDFASGIFDPYTIPFDVPFIIYGTVPAGVKEIVLKYSLKERTSRKHYRYRNIGSRTWQANLFSNASTFYFIVPPLTAIKEYRFSFDFVRNVLKEENADLNPKLKKILADHLDSCYNSFETDTVEDQVTFLLDNIENDKTLRTKLSNSIISYYLDKNIHLSMGVVAPIVNNMMYKLISENLYREMVNRARTNQEVLSFILETERLYSEKYDYFKYLKRLALPGNKLGLTADEIKIIGDFTNQNYMYRLFEGKQSFADIPSFTPKLSTSVFEKYALTTDSSVLVANAAAKLLDKISSTPELEAKFNKITGVTIASAIEAVKKTKERAASTANTLKDYYLFTKQATIKTESLNFDLNATFTIPVPIAGTTTADFVTRGEWHITADIGMAWVNTVPTTIIRPYFGVNFNLYPINRQADYSLVKAIAQRKPSVILKGVSLVTGLTALSISSDRRYLDALGSTSLLTGIGVRITDGTRLTCGYLWLYKKPDNTLLTDNKLTHIPYFSFSLDWDLKRWIRNFGKPIPNWTN